MKYRILAAATLVAALSAGAELNACGDKYLLSSWSLSFDQLYRAPNPGAVIIYAPAGSPAASKGYTNLQTLLTRAGHRVTIAQSVAELARVVSQLKADIVLADFSETAAITPGLPTTGAAPMVLPVMALASKAETAACKQRYPCQLKSADKPEKFVSTVNSAMKSRAKVLALKALRGN